MIFLQAATSWRALVTVNRPRQLAHVRLSGVRDLVKGRMPSWSPAVRRIAVGSVPTAGTAFASKRGDAAFSSARARASSPMMTMRTLEPSSFANSARAGRSNRHAGQVEA